jgi:hypothetical protein
MYFDAGYDRRAACNPRLRDLLILMWDEMEFDPRAAGVPHPRLSDLWVYETVGLVGVPQAVVLYEIINQDRYVTLWSLALR